MLKRLITIATAISLVFALGITVMAKDKTVYLEYENEESTDNYGPTVGLDWNVADRWTVSGSYQLEGDGPNEATTSLGATYAINKNLSAGLSYDTADSEDSVCVKLNGQHALKAPWTLMGGVAYTDYAEDVIADYHELELSVGTKYQFNEDLAASVSYVNTDPSNDDRYDKFVLGANYAIDDYGVYCKYEICDDDHNDKMTVGASYRF
jgi:long-subunit fatty acid transport protein